MNDTDTETEPQISVNCEVREVCLSLSVMVVISSWTASISLASLVRYWQRRSSCCRAIAMRRDKLCMQLMTDGSALALSANTTLNNIIVGISLLGEGSVLET